jgi:hypothetical protein
VGGMETNSHDNKYKEEQVYFYIIPLIFLLFGIQLQEACIRRYGFTIKKTGHMRPIKSRIHLATYLKLSATHNISVFDLSFPFFVSVRFLKISINQYQTVDNNFKIKKFDKCKYKINIKLWEYLPALKGRPII